MDCKDCNEICSCNECKRPHECACTCKYEFELKNVNECVNEVTKEEMLEQLKCYKFAIIELGLYLNTVSFFCLPCFNITPSTLLST